MRAERVFIGWDPHESQAFNVARTSLLEHAAMHHNIKRLSLDELQAAKLYTRPTHRLANGQLFDAISEAPMSTGHAIGRFFVPYLCGYRGWALFTDGDVLFREDIARLFSVADERYAVMCVQHAPMPEAKEKKGGHVQLLYSRKNWSSVMLFNCAHPANEQLTIDLLNKWPGRDLHAFDWLEDEEIGELNPGWNYLVGVTQPMPDTVQLAHFTLGVPTVPGHERDPFADEWRQVSQRAGYRAVSA